MRKQDRELVTRTLDREVGPPEVEVIAGGDEPARLGVGGAARCWHPAIEAGEVMTTK